MISASRRWPTSSTLADAGRAALAPAAVGLAAALTIVQLVRSDAATWTSVADLAVGWVLLAGGIALRRGGTASGRPGALMVATSLAWLVGGALHRGPLTHLLLTAPTGRVGGRWVGLVIVFAYVDGLLEARLPLDVLTLAWCLGLGLTGVARLARSSGVIRRGRAIASIGAAAISAVVAVDRILGLLERSLPGGLSSALYDLAIAAVAVALVVELRSGAWSGSAATGIVVELGASSDATSLRDRLAAVLGDPSLVVGFATGGGGFADEAGRPIERPVAGTGRAVLPVLDDGDEVAIVVHDASVLGDQGLSDAVAAATRIAVANLRLRAEIDDRAVALEASQRRLLRAEDDQRRRIERRLSEGALRRLGRLRTLVSEPSLAGAVARAPIDLRVALGDAEADLRAFARGVYPPSLSSAGLAAAVEELASGTGERVEVSLPAARLASEVEVAAYFVCAEALANAAKHAQATRVGIAGALDGGVLRITVTDDGIGGADASGSGLQGLRDRLAVIGGVLDVHERPGGGTVVTATVPATTVSGEPAAAVSRPA